MEHRSPWVNTHASQKEVVPQAHQKLLHEIEQVEKEHGPFRILPLKHDGCDDDDVVCSQENRFNHAQAYFSYFEI